MKKVFVITFAVAFGCTSALLIGTILLMMSGVLKQNVFGGIYWDLGQHTSDDGNDYDKKQKLLASLQFENIRYVRDGDYLKVMYDVTNPNSESIDDVALLNYVFNKEGKLVAIVDDVQSYDLAGNGKATIIGEIMKGTPDDFDEIIIMVKQ